MVAVQVRDQHAVYLPDQVSQPRVVEWQVNQWIPPPVGRVLDGIHGTRPAEHGVGEKANSVEPQRTGCMSQ
jgi:hypothetical protein